MSIERLGAALADRYRIERQLGQGGMATVYLADDIKHDRKVAIKVLKPELAAVLGAERFVVEIKTTASLQHPHILPLFDSGTADGFLFYVMPFIDGETLRDKLNRETQLGVDEAVKIATDVADALHYAHSHGVIHRDIKPENILLANGRPMVADFGIALAVSAAAGGRMTETGLSLGTPHYMSPEQATAEKEITARSDVYSLASVLYEMLAGQPPHSGGSAQQIIMKIITEQAQSVTSLRKSVPEQVAEALAIALEKLPADRFASAKEFSDALHGTAGTTALAARRRQNPAPWLRDTRSRAAVGAASVLGVLLIVSTIWPRSGAREAEHPAIMSRLAFASGDRIAGLPAEESENADRPSRTAIAISPDGSSLVFRGERAGVHQLFLRPLIGETATPIAGTEGAESPFFSSDGASIGYWADGRLMRAALKGGQPSQLALVGRITGATWDNDRIVVGGYNTGLIMLSASGAHDPDTLTPPGASLPQFLPGGAAIVFSQRSGWGTHDTHLEVLTVATGARKLLVNDAADGRYVAPGHIVFGRAGTMMAAVFDPRSLALTSSPVVVLDDVMQSFNGNNTDVLTGAMQVAISPNGDLVYLTGGIAPDGVRRLYSLDRQGKPTRITAAGEHVFFMALLSPDETKLAVTMLGSQPATQVVDLKRETALTLTDPGLQTWPLWSRDGLRVLRQGTVRDSVSLVWSPADGSRAAEGIIPNKVLDYYPAFWSTKGDELFAYPADFSGLHAINVATGAVRSVANLPADIAYPTLSPDGNWIAYTSGEVSTRLRQVFVQPWPALDRKLKVSTAGGQAPKWIRGGRELVYLEAAADTTGVCHAAVRTDGECNRVMSVTVMQGSTLAPQTPQMLFLTSFAVLNPIRGYDVTSDGSRFFVLMGQQPRARPGDLRVVSNWLTELKRRVAVKPKQ